LTPPSICLGKIVLGLFRENQEGNEQKPNRGNQFSCYTSQQKDKPKGLFGLQRKNIPNENKPNMTRI